MNILHRPPDDGGIEYHKTREAQECELAHSAKDINTRNIHFEMAEQHAAIVMISRTLRPPVLGRQ